MVENRKNVLSAELIETFVESTWLDGAEQIENAQSDDGTHWRSGCTF